MYYPYFIAYMAIGFTISLVVFFWALNTGQFKDQQRARFIPLESDRPTKAGDGIAVCAHPDNCFIFAGLSLSGIFGGGYCICPD